MKKRRVIIILLLAAIGAGVWMWRSGMFTTPDNRILVSGNLELTLVDISFKVAGRMTELNVREGDWVKRGDTIARLDSQQLQRQETRDKTAISSAESGYQQLQTAIAYQQATLETDIAARRAEVNEAQAHLDLLLAGNRPQEIQQADSAVADAKAQLDLARREWDRAEALYKNEDISTSQHDQARTKFESATALLRQAEERSGMIHQGARPEEIAGARATVARANAALQTTEAARLDIRRKQEELVARRAEVDRAKAQVSISQSQLDDTQVVTPIDGVVLSKSAEGGEVLAAGTTIVSIGDLDHPWLRAYINETDLGRVKLGAKVKLTTDSFPGKSYSGQISFISPEAEFTPKQIQTKEERVKLVYRIKIEVDNTSRELKNNMPVDAEITL